MTLRLSVLGTLNQLSQVLMMESVLIKIASRCQPLLLTHVNHSKNGKHAKLMIVALSITNQSSQVQMNKLAHINSNRIRTELLLKNAQALTIKINVDTILLASGTNAEVTSEITNSHAQPKRIHTASNPTETSIQEDVVITRMIPSNVSQLKEQISRIEKFFFLALFRTRKIYASLLQNVHGLESRIHASILLDGTILQDVPVRPLLKEPVKTENSNPKDSPLLYTTTHRITAALVVSKSKKRPLVQLFHSIQLLSITNVPAKLQMKETGESLSTAMILEVTTGNATMLTTVKFANRNVVKDMRNSRLTSQPTLHLDLPKPSKPDKDQLRLISLHPSTKLPILNQRELNAVSVASHSTEMQVETLH